MSFEFSWTYCEWPWLAHYRAFNHKGWVLYLGPLRIGYGALR